VGVHHLAAGERAVTLRIMLVDDNLTFLASVKTTLRLVAGTEVVAEAHNAAQALEMAQRLTPDLMLLDIVMPGQSGLEVVKTMQSWPQSPRVLFLTMHDNESYRAAAQDMGALGLVGKANFVAELLPIISDLAGQSNEVSP
jgi:DNA-binding NarL/FixJ family response regulator